METVFLCAINPDSIANRYVERTCAVLDDAALSSMDWYVEGVTA